MRYMIRPPLRAYATGGTCTPDTINPKVFNYKDSDGHFGQGANCAAAKAAYDRAFGNVNPNRQAGADRTGLSPASGDNTASTLKKQTDAFNKQKEASQLGKLPAVPLPDFSSIAGPSGKDAGTSPAGCKNCTNTGGALSFLDPSAWGCKFGKLSCEWGHAAGQGFEGIMQFIKDNALFIIGGGLVAIVLLTKVFRMI